MAKDYSGNIATAQRLITKFGRAITLVQFNDTETDIAKPWEGNTAPRTVPDATLAIDAVFVFPTGLLNLGLGADQRSLLARSEQICILSPGATADISIYQEIIDTDLSRWTIQTTEQLKPANDTVLAYLGLRR